MANKQGDFIWYELITNDVAAAADFYGKVIGWAVQAYPGGVEGYNILTTPEGGHVGGLMSNEKLPDLRPRWFGYVAVDDVDAKAAELTAAGAQVQMPPTTLEGVGRLAMLADPQGSPFYIMKGASEGTSDSFNQAKTGHGNWNELSTTDQAAALDFYGKAFGWSKGDTIPMGPMGDYYILHHGQQPIGGVMTKQDNPLPVGWTPYFGVADIEVSAKAITESGGKILHGPAEVPGGALIVIALDPQAALFGVVGPGPNMKKPG